MNVNQNIVISNHPFNSNDKNDIVSSSSPSPRSSRSSSPSKTNSLNRNNQNLILMRPKPGQRSMSHSKTPSSRSNSISRSNSGTLSSNYSSRDSLYENSNNNNNNNTNNSKDKKFKTVKKKQRIQSRSRSRIRQNISNHDYNTNHMHNRMPIDKSIDQDQFKYREKPIRRESKSPDNLYEHQSSKVYSHSARHEPDYHLEKNSSRSNKAFYNPKNYDNAYLKNEKMRGSSERNRESEFTRHHVSRENYHHHHHQNSRPRSIERRPSSRERTRNYNEEDERERYAGDYTSICLKNLNESLRVDDLREHIQNEFKSYRNFSVKVVNNRKGSGYSGSSQLSEKIAFVNFNNHQDAKHAKRTKSNKLFFGYQLHIEPVFRNRSSNEDFGRSNSSSNYRNISPVPKRNYYRSPSPTHKQKFYSQRPKSPDFNVPKEKTLANEGIKSRNTFYSQRSRSRSRTPNRLHFNKTSYHIKDSQPKNSNNENNGEQNIHRDQYKEKIEGRSPIQNQNQHQKEESIKFESNKTLSRNQELFLDQTKPLSNPSVLLNEEKVKNVLKDEIQDSNKHEKADFEDFREKSSIQNLEPKPSTLTSLQPINSIDKVQPLNITHSTKLCHSSTSSKSRSCSSSPNRLLKKKYRDNLIPKQIKRSPSFQSGSYSGNKQYGYETTNNKLEHTRDEHRLRPLSPSPKSKEYKNRSRSIEQNKKPYDDSSYKHGLAESKSKLNSSQYGGVSHYFDDDEKDATRTLFIGNLDNQIDTKDLIRIFEKYGTVEEIDIKRNQPFLPSYQLNNSDYFMNSNISMTNRKTYAFIKYLNMDMAMEAKFHLNGKKIGRHHTECKIGYGKVQSTNCLWVGGLIEKSRKTDLENEFEYFANSTIQKSLKASAHEIYKKKLVEIDWRPGGHLYAYVLFPTISQAEEARFQMRGKRLPGSSSERLRIDYVDPKKFIKQSYMHSRSSRPHTPLTPPPHEYISQKRSRSSSIEKKRSIPKRTDHEFSSRQIEEIKSNSQCLTENDNQHDHFRKFETSSQIDRNSKVKPFDLYPSETSFAKSQLNSNATKRSLTRSESKSPVNFKQITNLGSEDNRRVIGLSSPPRKIIENYVPCEDQINTSNSKYNEDKSVTPLIESPSSLRLINKSKPSDSISLLSCSKLENIIITKTENTRLVNTVSDLLHTTQLDQFKTEIKLNASSALTAELEMVEKNQIEHVTMHSIHLNEQKLTTSSQDQNHLISHWNTDNQIQKESYNPPKEIKSLKQNEIKNSTVETKSKEIDDSFQDRSSYDELSSVRSSQKERHHRNNVENTEYNEPETYESSSPSSNVQKRKQNDHNEEKASYKKSTTSLSCTFNSSKLINETQINKRLLNNNLKSIDLISTLIENSWSGIFTLKKHIFPTKFYLIGGSKEFAEQILPQQNQQQSSLHNCLRISQRLRLDESKLDELEKKLFEVNHHLNKADMHTFSVLVSVPSDQLNSQLADNQYHQRSLHNLISYLDQKNAAGVIPLPDDDKPNSMMHAFTPNCSLSNKLVNQLFPHIKRVVNANILANNDFIIIIIFKQNLNNNNINGKVCISNTI